MSQGLEPRWEMIGRTAVLSLLVLGLGLGCGCKNGGHAGVLGERISVEEWPDVVALELRRQVSHDELYPAGGLRSEPPAADEEIVAIEVQIINDEDEPFTVEPFTWFALRSQGKDIEATFELFSEKVLEEKTLAPDRELTGLPAYTISEGLRDLELVYQPEAAEALSEFFQGVTEDHLRIPKVKQYPISLEP